MTYSRSTRDLCGDCWQTANPSDYLPATTRYGTCSACDIAEMVPTLVYRSAVAEPTAERLAYADQLTRFATLGRLVAPVDVPGYVRAGFDVWSFQYGDDPDSFTTLDRDDLDTIAHMTPEELAAMWGPFRATVRPDGGLATALWSPAPAAEPVVTCDPCPVCGKCRTAHTDTPAAAALPPGCTGHEPDPMTDDAADELAAALGDPDATDLLTLAGRLANVDRHRRYVEAVELADLPPSVLATRSTSPDYRQARRELVAVWSGWMASARRAREYAAAPAVGAPLARIIYAAGRSTLPDIRAGY